VGDLETLEAVAALGLATNDIEDLVDELGTLSVVTLGPVVSGTGLTEDEVVGAEELTEWASTDGIHGTWLQIDENGTRHVLVAGGLSCALLEQSLGI
jgi:proteasome assembly chaperone (PAC2) family protein